MLRRWCASLWVLALALVALPATAHQLGKSYCNVLSVPGGLDVSVETTAEHLVPVLGLATLPDDGALLALRGALDDALRKTITARTPSGPCSVESDPPVLGTREGARAVSVTLHFSCPPGPVTLHNAWRLDVDPRSEVVCAIDGSAWVFRLGLEDRDVGAPPTLGQVLGGFVKLGVHHVLSGVDHVLFVMALLLAAALAARGRTLRAGLGRMATIVTGFTLGHSVTLIAAGLGVIRVDPRITESIIALSIVVVAVENVLRDEIRWRVVTATLFGLVHGFGFASVLAETELPRRGAVPALLSFNVGIELAQLGIVLLVFPGLALAARKLWYERVVMRPASILIASLAAVWLVKRVFGLHFLPWLGS